MTMLKKLKSLFVVEDEHGASAAKPVESGEEDIVPEVKSGTVIPDSDVSPRADTSVAGGKVSDKFLNILLAAMDKQNLDGFDYLEYKQSLQSLDQISMDEPTKYRSAFAMAQTMGANASNLVKTAQHYLQVLAEEEKKFEQALVNQRNLQITEKEQNLKSFNQSIADKTSQIQKLTEEINQIRKNMENMTGELQEAQFKLDSTKNDFLITYQSLVDHIRKDIENMNQYLK
ncbi:MAG: hypothetical protein KDC28_00985 [Saprospiraceae bacterium]|nr:hypothetical protein [Saprospiraceae bacterium]MCB9319942.1 hypothetical protein [Lewinellaceae bacterium]